MTGCAALRPQITSTDSSPQGAGDGDGEGDGAAAASALHERLVAYAHFVAGDSERRSGVWGEHSYARARDAAAPEVRELLTAAPWHDVHDAHDAPLDVLHAPRDRTPALRVLDEPARRDEDDHEYEEEDEWAERVGAQAPSGAHARLAGAAAEALREMRLARLASAGARGGAWLRREQARAAARRLRRALAPLWACGGAGARAPAWLHGALTAALPRCYRALYDELLAELRRAVPRLADRLSPQLPPVPVDPLELVHNGTCRPAEGSEDVVLVWVCANGEADERWLRRLRPLVQTHELRAAPPWPAGAGAAARLPPDRWCAAAAGAARTRLNDLLAEIGSQYVVLGGAGAGAALSVALAAGMGSSQVGAAQGRVCALLLLAPPLLTAEGARDEPDDILHEMRLPMLAVCGGGGAASGRAAGAELVARGARGERAARRLLLLGGADDALRVPAALRRAVRLPQHALDAAVADECARWVRGAARVPLERPERTERAERLLPDAVMEDDEYAQLPSGGARAPATRMVTRVSGGTPLALVPPRRAPDALELADIMQLPIVFADDGPPVHAATVSTTTTTAAAAAAAAGPCAGGGATGESMLTVRSGARGKLTRVIVARRGGRAGRVRTAPRAPRACAPSAHPAPEH